MKKSGFAPGLVAGGAVAIVGWFVWGSLTPSGPRPPIIIKGRSLTFARKDADFPLVKDKDKPKYTFNEKIDHLDGTLSKLLDDPVRFPRISKIELKGTGTPNCTVSLVGADLVVECDMTLEEKNTVFTRQHWQHPTDELPAKLKIYYGTKEEAEFNVDRHFDIWLDYP